MNKSDVMSLLGLDSDVSLLEHLPSKYESLKPTFIKPIEQYEDGERACFFIKIKNVKIVMMQHLIRFDGELSFLLSFHFALFNQRFYANRLKTGNTLFVVCYYNKRMKAFMVSSLYDVESKYVKAGLKPVYRLPKKIPQSTFAFIIDRILHSQTMLYLKDRVPSEFVRKYKLLPRAKAFECVHQPTSEEDLKKGLRVFKYEECLAYCLKIQLNKKYLSIEKKINNKSIDRTKIQQFIEKLPFQLTSDQLKAIDEILTDMNSNKVMFRLLQGDVSTGKTIVAFLAIYANYLRGGQSVMFAPTTSLVSQHFKNALKIFDGTGIRIQALLSKVTKKQQHSIYEELQKGKCDVLITTLAGINENIKYKNLTLSIIDEQQNFGVEQRSLMIKKGSAVDTLMMSATPIPRTLNKIKNGDMSLSEIKQYPNQGKRMVETKVLKSNDPLIDKAIKAAMEKQRQIFIVVPRIDENEGDIGNRISAKEVYEEYSKRYGKDKVQLLNGRMKQEEQEKVLKEFSENKKPILVTTSVIEVGIDIKDAGLMIIYSANFFGLSALHQLRGRIGRNGKYAMAILVYDGRDKKALEKLNFLASSNDGFAIAEYDFKMRGGGALSGTQQWGESNLFVADFSNDLTIFECAMADAEEIITNLKSNQEFNDYANNITKEDEKKDILLA